MKSEAFVSVDLSVSTKQTHMHMFYIQKMGKALKAHIQIQI